MLSYYFAFSIISTSLKRFVLLSGLQPITFTISPIEHVLFSS